MKQKDIALIIIVIVFSAITSLVVSTKIFGATAHDQTAEVVEPISDEFKTPDAKYFNSNSFDPTETINIDQSANTDPFRGSGQ